MQDKLTQDETMQDKKNITREQEKIQFVHDTFYQAFRKGNWGLMQSLWTKSEGISVIHPGRPPINGYDDVMESWKNILEEPPNIKIMETSISTFGNFALITCIETVNDYILSAVNGLVNENGNWHLYYHHSSIIMSEFLEYDDENNKNDNEIKLH